MSMSLEDMSYQMEILEVPDLGDNDTVKIYHLFINTTLYELLNLKADCNFMIKAQIEFLEIVFPICAISKCAE